MLLECLGKKLWIQETHEPTWIIYEFNQGNAVVFFHSLGSKSWCVFFRRGVCWSKGPPTGFCIEKRHRSGVSTSKELVRDKNMRCHFWMDGKNWMAQVMVNEWYHHVTSWSYIRSSSNLHSTAPFLLKMAQTWEWRGEKNLIYLLEKTGYIAPPCLDGSFGGELRSLSSKKKGSQIPREGPSEKGVNSFVFFFWFSFSEEAYLILPLITSSALQLILPHPLVCSKS